MVCMGKIKNSDAFEILVKNDREDILKNYGEVGLARAKDYFIIYTNNMVDINDESVKEAFINKVELVRNENFKP